MFMNDMLEQILELPFKVWLCVIKEIIWHQEEIRKWFKRHYIHNNLKTLYQRNLKEPVFYELSGIVNIYGCLKLMRIRSELGGFAYKEVVRILDEIPVSLNPVTSIQFYKEL
ncbi:hypothetical protein BDC45DRAFT_534800 [Circinella umbellata]|nr:hypothetical protein BDC45DRAFT_534800 [Circinella umbellata]